MSPFSFPAARCWSRADLIPRPGPASLTSSARRCTIRMSARGRSSAACIPRAKTPAPACCPMAMSSSRGARAAISRSCPPRKCTTRLQTLGHPPRPWGTNRYGQMATLLPSGRVLVAGGGNNSGAMSEAELYDYAPGGWTQAGTNVNVPSGYTTSTTLLPNGQALAVGDTAAALFNPVTSSWSNTGSLSTSFFPYHTATLLPNGKVLVTGGYGMNTTELYDPASSTWSVTGAMNTNHYVGTVVMLANGKALAFGGSDTNGNYIT